MGVETTRRGAELALHGYWARDCGLRAFNFKPKYWGFTTAFSGLVSLRLSSGARTVISGTYGGYLD